MYNMLITHLYEVIYLAYKQQTSKIY